MLKIKYLGLKHIFLLSNFDLKPGVLVIPLPPVLFLLWFLNPQLLVMLQYLPVNCPKNYGEMGSFMQ